MTAKAYRVDGSKVVSETLDGETIIVNLETGTYYSMNGDGTAAWEAVLAQAPLEPSTKEAEEFLALLVKEGLAAESEPAPASVPAEVGGAPALSIHADMQAALQADPIHDVESGGWPIVRKDTAA